MHVTSSTHGTATWSTCNEADVALVSPALDAVSEYVPGALIERFPKLATPPLAAAVVVPLRVPLPALGPRATAIVAVELVTREPPPSMTSTCSTGPSGSYGDALIGCPTRASAGVWPATNRSTHAPVTVVLR